MGAGVQRWWRLTFEQEVARHDSTRPIARDNGLVRCVDEDGIECRLRLYTVHPMYYGKFTIS